MIELETRLGPLSCRVLQDGDANTRPVRAVVLCHGFGAPGDDLVALGHELLRRRQGSGSGPVRFVFPEAPLSLEEIGYGDGRAWWQIDFARLEAATRNGEVKARLETEVPEGLVSARRQLAGVVDAVLQQTGLPMSRVVLGGFSQGAMITTDLALRLEEAPAGLAILSGAVIARDEWVKRAPTRQGLRVFQTHGRFDPLLPFTGAESLRDLLTGAGLQVDFHPFDGVHTIAMESLAALGRFVLGD
jgi:phospholipase/carboxylesterase